MKPALEASYEATFADLHRRAQRAAHVIVGDRDLACDVAQEVMFRAYRRWPRIHSYSAPWVTRVATNEALSHLRSSGRRSIREQANAPAESLDATISAVAQAALRADLTDELARLPRRQREVLVLRHLYGFSADETARAMGVSVGSVKSHSDRARTTMRSRLGGDYFVEATT